MGLFDKIFKKLKPSNTEAKIYLSDAKIKQRSEDFMSKLDQVKNLFNRSLDIYNSEFCQCACPRSQQIIGIDCSNMGNSFKCQNTDFLISLSNKYFNISKSDLTDEITN